MITENYASFEVASLMNELGFHSNESRQKFDSNGNSFLKTDYNFWSVKFVNSIERPTLSLSINWLSEEFGLWVWVERDMKGNFYPKIDIITEKSWQDQKIRNIKGLVQEELRTKWHKSLEESLNLTLKLLLTALKESSKETSK
jgi:hypothetical protein